MQTPSWMQCAIATALALAIGACGGGGGDDDDVGPPLVFGGDRPVELQVPELLEGETYPLVVILHGYGASGFLQQAYFEMSDLAEREGVFVVAPDGLTDSAGRQFWNADATCCDFDGANPDDVGYLGGLIDDVAAAWPVDRARIRVIGHSNGGFMAYRLACERADVVTSIVVLAGVAASVPCTPAAPVHVLHLHGTADELVPYAAAEPSVDEWAGHNGCTGARAAAGTIDVDGAVAGDETEQAVTAGCPDDGAVELWTMTGSGHLPNLLGGFDTTIAAWWRDHPRR